MQKRCLLILILIAIGYQSAFAQKINLEEFDVVRADTQASPIIVTLKLKRYPESDAGGNLKQLKTDVTIKGCNVTDGSRNFTVNYNGEVDPTEKIYGPNDDITVECEIPVGAGNNKLYPNGTFFFVNVWAVNSSNQPIPAQRTINISREKKKASVTATWKNPNWIVGENKIKVDLKLSEGMGVEVIMEKPDPAAPTDITRGVTISKQLKGFAKETFETVEFENTDNSATVDRPVRFRIVGATSWIDVFDFTFNNKSFTWEKAAQTKPFAINRGGYIDIGGGVMAGTDALKSGVIEINSLQEKAFRVNTTADSILTMRIDDTEGEVAYQSTGYKAVHDIKITVDEIKKLAATPYHKLKFSGRDQNNRTFNEEYNLVIKLPVLQMTYSNISIVEKPVQQGAAKTTPYLKVSYKLSHASRHQVRFPQGALNPTSNFVDPNPQVEYIKSDGTKMPNPCKVDAATKVLDCNWEFELESATHAGSNNTLQPVRMEIYGEEGHSNSTKPLAIIGLDSIDFQPGKIRDEVIQTVKNIVEKKPGDAGKRAPFAQDIAVAMGLTTREKAATEVNLNTEMGQAFDLFVQVIKERGDTSNNKDRFVSILKFAGKLALGYFGIKLP